MPTSNFQPVRLLDPDCCYKFTYLMANSAGPDQLASSESTGTVVECPLCDREVAGSIPGRVIPKTLKMVLAALSLGAQHSESRARTGQLSVSIM